MGRNFAEAEPVLHFLNREGIPHFFQEVGDDFNAQTPACYLGEYKHYGVENLERIKTFYRRTLNESQKDFAR